MSVSLGLGLGVSVSGTTSGVVPSFLYLMAQDGDILEAQSERGSPASPTQILYEPNDIPSDAPPDPTELLLTQDTKVILTEDGKGLAQEPSDRPYARFITQDKKLVTTQDGQPLVAQEVQPDSTIQEFTTQDGRFLFTQSGDQLTTT